MGLFLGPYTDAAQAFEETRRSVAEVLGASPDEWPSHGNAPLAIAATVALLRQRNGNLLVALREIVACEGGAWHVERYERERQEALAKARKLIAEYDARAA